MKKITLLLFVAIANFGMQAQVLLTENATSLTVGNIGTDVTGVTPGQGGWLTFSGVNSDYQIENQAGVYGNSIKVIGSNTATGTKYLFKDLTTAWNARTSGNNIGEVDFNFFTGPATTSLNSMRVVLYDATGGKVLGGFRITMNTLVVSGLAYYNNAGTLGNYAFNLGAAGAAVTLLPNTWYKFGFSFNKTTGEIKFKESSGLFNVFVMGASTGIDVAELDFVAATATGNTVAGNGIFDNLNAKASSTDTLLGVKSNEIVSAKFAVYPNPAKEVITVFNTLNAVVSSIEMTDLNGRIVKKQTVNATEVQVSINDLATGTYIIKIATDQGTVTKKVIKE